MARRWPVEGKIKFLRYGGSELEERSVCIGEIRLLAGKGGDCWPPAHLTF